MKSLIDAEVEPFLINVPKLDLNRETLLGIRAGAREQAEALQGAATKPENVLISTVVVPPTGAAPEVKLRCLRPKNMKPDAPALFHIHGGGYVLGSAEMMDEYLSELVLKMECSIFSVDYRLAPETKFPGAIEDCYAALKWVWENAGELEIDRTRLGIMGESAGGGLGASLALLVRDRAELVLAFQHLIYPMIDDRTCVRPNTYPFGERYGWSFENNIFGWSCLLTGRPGDPDISPYAAAARAENLLDLPPAFISVGALDLFAEENMVYAQRLMLAGVPVELHVYPKAFHGSDFFAPDARVSLAAKYDSHRALRRALHG